MQRLARSLMTLRDFQLRAEEAICRKSWYKRALLLGIRINFSKSIKKYEDRIQDAVQKDV